MSSNLHKPAYPGNDFKYLDEDTGAVIDLTNHGLSKLEYFAAKALQGLCANPNMAGLAETARSAVEMASAALAELERRNGQPVERDRS